MQKRHFTFPLDVTNNVELTISTGAKQEVLDYIIKGLKYQKWYMQEIVGYKTRWDVYNKYGDIVMDISTLYEIREYLECLDNVKRFGDSLADKLGM